MPIFQLEYHFTMFAVREISNRLEEAARKPHRHWIDLTFMMEFLPDLRDDYVRVLYPEQISVTICGTSETSYIVYCFHDNEFDEDRELGEYEPSMGDFIPDQIFNAKEDLQDANMPIWNPREYFLMTLASRIKQVVEEWTRLIQTIDTAFGEFISQLLPSNKHGAGLWGHEIPRAFDWTQKLLRIVRKLLPILSGTINVWECFNSPKTGDIGFFSDLEFTPCANRITATLYEIEEAFDELKNCQEKLQGIQKQCEEEQAQFVMDESIRQSR